MFWCKTCGRKLRISSEGDRKSYSGDWDVCFTEVAMGGCNSEVADSNERSGCVPMGRFGAGKKSVLVV